MFNEHDFIAQVEAAGTEELIELLRRPSEEQERALRAHFGDERYQNMHSLALKRSLRRGTDEKRGNVVILPGIMGSDLAAFDRTDKPSPIWVNILRLVLGGIEMLQLDKDGRTDLHPEANIRATGVLKRHYGELILSLSEHWNVQPFGYDWRKDVGIAAADLESKIRSWFDEKQPVHLVAHSLGGLVARAFIRNYPERWQAMAGRNLGEDDKRAGKLIMLGTPNYGSLAILGAINGQDNLLKVLQLADIRHNRTELLEILRSFPSLYQIMPPPNAPGVDSAKLLYELSTYGDLDLPLHHLQDAVVHHESMSKVIGSNRMIYIAGCNQPTFSNIKSIAHLLTDPYKAFEVTWNGDNRVTHTSGILKKPDGTPIKTYYVEEGHGNLPANRRVIAAVGELLQEGTTQVLDEEIPARPKSRSTSEAAAREQMKAAELTEQEQERLSRIARRVHNRQTNSDGGVSRAQTPTDYISPEQRELEEALTREFLSYRDPREIGAKAEPPFKPAEIEIRLLHSGIEEAHGRNTDGPPVDAISVGHYFGLRPEPRTAEYALDQAISKAQNGKKRRRDPYLGEQPYFLLTQFSERGIIRGELGQPFFLKDPRQSTKDQGPERLLAIAGMGVVGRFGEPELTVLVRELIWSLGRLGKQHLATVLIGAGNRTLSERDAINGWVRGIKQAITGANQREQSHLKRITFVEFSWSKLRPIQEAIIAERDRLGDEGRLIIKYQEISPARLDKLEQEGRERDYRNWLKNSQAKPSDEEGPRERASTRVTVELDDRTRTYRFGALTETASIPQREIPLDPDLVTTANEELAGEWNVEQQRRRGQFLEGLLIPSDLRPALYTDAPLILLLDSTTARIHWEMLAQTVVGRSAQSDENPSQEEINFLGISRSLTRQLRTTFAPPPEPPPPPRRMIRVLVVADPAEDAHLPGAEEEGVEVADLFESFNRIYEKRENRVQVVRLFGPREATRTAVLRHLMLQSYDILHFAGHCSYEPQEPNASGWIFTGGKRLTANELKRIDRIPKFVFSNACESGITPDRSGARSVDLAPSFAERFFERGVANFVCTAWPVDDFSARTFATTLYAGLLGLIWNPAERRYEPTNRPAPMHVAMRQARKAVSENDSYDARTWGAYQHYGNPFMQLFDAASLGSPVRPGSSRAR